jgi:hypothetical protein
MIALPYGDENSSIKSNIKRWLMDDDLDISVDDIVSISVDDIRLGQEKVLSVLESVPYRGVLIVNGNVTAKFS